ncbi:hypothetical protein GTY54_03725, partial [Streptomyces sp. SID625]|nr:hypothetical protein [Streptomyces sp. SID625]
GLPLDGAPGDSAYGQVTVRAITQTVWPPGADRCAWLIWQPAARYQQAAGVREHWRAGLARLTQAVRDAGLDYRTRDRPWDPLADRHADLLVYRPRP